jgi:hypothetical protein
LHEEVCWGEQHAQVLVGRWRRQYNEERPPSALGYRTPAEAAARTAEPTSTASAPVKPTTMVERPGLTSRGDQFSGSRSNRPAGKLVLARGLRRLLDHLATAAILADEIRQRGSLPPRIAALLGRPATD